MSRAKPANPLYDQSYAKVLADGRRADARAAFTRMGWSDQDWAELTDPATWAQVSSGHLEYVLNFLDHEPEAFVTPVTVREVFIRYGKDGGHVLTAYADGASPRFVDAFTGVTRQRLNDTVGAMRARLAWMNAKELRLPEDQAIGWVHADLLDYVDQQVVITAWVDLFGPKAYLWPLAGFTLTEATALEADGTVVSEDQLRVMAALAGAVLPAGV
ncbi:MAG: hypothetical protein ACOH1Y_17935 [Propionicimonas sp.]